MISQAPLNRLVISLLLRALSFTDCCFSRSDVPLELIPCLIFVFDFRRSMVTIAHRIRFNSKAWLEPKAGEREVFQCFEYTDCELSCYLINPLSSLVPLVLCLRYDLARTSRSWVRSWNLITALNVLCNISSKDSSLTLSS